MVNAQTEPTTIPPVQKANDRIHVMVRNRNQVLFEDDVKAVTSKNDTGVFDILPEHSNFISVINESVTVHKLDGQAQKFPLANGVMKVKNSTVNCYLDLITNTNTVKSK